MNRKTIVRITAVASALAFVAYWHFKAKAGAAGATVDAPKARSIPQDAKSFRLGTLDFKACQLDSPHSGATTPAFCAPFQVPESWDAPTDRKLDLHLVLIKSEADAANTDVVVFLDGGPGEAATEDYPVLAPAFAPLRRHHHILLLDQRGTGQSHPLVCKKKRQEPDESAVEKAFDPEEVRRTARECLAEVEAIADPRLYTTTVATRDLEALRQALGAPELDLYGVSYGTRMAQQYLMRYPDGVRSVVLDSVVPNELALGEDHAVNLDEALKAQFARCKETPACATAFGDPYESLFELRDTLRAKPEKYTYRDPATNVVASKRIDSSTLAGLVRIFAYSPETAALLPLSISEGRKGNFTPLAGQNQLLTGDLAWTEGNGMQYSVICSEDADRLTPRPQDKATLLGSAFIDSLIAICSVWPRGTVPDDFHTPLATDKPLLVLEGELDPATPPRYGEQVVRGASNAKLIVAKGQGHGLLLRGCVPKLVQQFVDSGQPKKLDTSCVDAMGPLPALVDFNGAAP